MLYCYNMGFGDRYNFIHSFCLEIYNFISLGRNWGKIVELGDVVFIENLNIQIQKGRDNNKEKICIIASEQSKIRCSMYSFLYPIIMLYFFPNILLILFINVCFLPVTSSLGYLNSPSLRNQVFISDILQGPPRPFYTRAMITAFPRFGSDSFISLFRKYWHVHVFLR